MTIEHPLTEICYGDLFVCIEHRTVEVCGKEVELTAKEFDIFALLIMNPKRVFTYEKIMELVWSEKCDFYSRKAINNHISNLRKKIMISETIPNCIISVHSIGYKFVWKPAE